MSAADYGDHSATFYDTIYGAPHADTVQALARLARGGAVLELGLATGRTALALQRRGLKVTGIEASAAMLARLREKPEAENIRIIKGDFSTVTLTEKFALIFALVDTFFLLTTRAQQANCLENLAVMLEPEGVLVIEAFRPDEADVMHTPAGLRVNAVHELDLPQGRCRYPVNLLYQEPAALAELAAQAGLKLAARWSNWRQKEYQDADIQCISIFSKRPDLTIPFLQPV